jgi:methylmalonyl-CoA decarboxylase subunit alpha
VRGPKGAVEVLEGRKIREFTDKEEAAKYTKQKEEEYRSTFANPYQAARFGYIDDVIEPRNTRFRIIRALQTLATKKDTLPPKKHGNIPL